MVQTVEDLATRQCKACEGGVAPLTEAEIRNLLKQLEGWECVEGRISKTYRFKDYYQTMAFNGLSENDFICAAKLDRLFAL